MNIIIPHFFDCYLYNKQLINDFSFSKFCKIKGVSGSFPFSIFHGGVNNFNKSENTICLYKNMEESLNFYKDMEIILLDYSAFPIDEKDYYNNYAKVQLESFNEYPNIYFILTDKNYINYLVNKYPNIKIILSKDFDYEDKDFINKYKRNIKGLISNDIKILKDSNLSIKIYFVGLYNCNFCNYKDKCREIDRQNILNFSIKSIYQECKNIKMLNFNEIFFQYNEIKNISDYILFDESKINSKEFYSYLFNLFKEVEGKEL